MIYSTEKPRRNCAVSICKDLFTFFEENQEFLKQIMSILDASEQEIITLHIVSGLKHAEIAKLLGKPLSTVLSKYHRAIKKLQSNLKEAG